MIYFSIKIYFYFVNMNKHINTKIKINKTYYYFQ